MRLVNTLTGRKEEFLPLHPPQVTLYVCGVTVYDDCHIGHARGAVVFDVLLRYLIFKGYQVTYARNITDLDDKIIDRARHWGQAPDLRELQEVGKRGLTPLDLKMKVQLVAEHFTERFQADFSRLGLLSPTHEPKATEYLPKMIAFMEELLRRGMAYVGSDGVYFSVRKFPSYGKLSHQNPDQMLAGARSEAVEAKKDLLDFALWKRAKPEEPSWASPWGPGRPGWHIECSTMSTALLGDSFDIHGGGGDLIFPHHENEIAQAQGAGKPFARVWLHNGLLTVNGQKMSKSVGNIVTIEETLKRHPAEVLRLFFLTAHYRSPIDFTWERLKETAHAYERLFGFLTQVDQRIGPGEEEEPPAARAAREKFVQAMDDDLNTPEALSALYGLVAQALPWLEERGSQAMKKLRAVRTVLQELAGVLGLSFGQEVPVAIRELIRERDEARRRGDFKKADQIRMQLKESGYLLEDTAGGTVVRKRV